MPVIGNGWRPIVTKTNQIRVITLFPSNAVKKYCFNSIVNELAVNYENRRRLIPFSDVISNPNYFIWNHIGKELPEWSLWLVIFDSSKFYKIFNTNIFVQRLIFGSYVYKLYNETTRKSIWRQAFTVPDITEITYKTKALETIFFSCESFGYGFSKFTVFYHLLIAGIFSSDEAP